MIIRTVTTMKIPMGILKQAVTATHGREQEATGMIIAVAAQEG